MPESLPFQTPEKEAQVTILKAISGRIVELSEQHSYWLAGGRMYLDRDLICRDAATNEPTVILWQGREYTLELDQKDRVKIFSLTEMLPAEFSFKITEKTGGGQKFIGAKISRLTPRNLLSFLSDGSLSVEYIPFEGRFDEYAQKIVFGPKKEREPLRTLFPNLITLIVDDDNQSRISYDSAKDISFSDLNGDRWYPDFSRSSGSSVIKKHGRDYIYVYCWNSQKNGSRDCLLSRPEGFGKFEKHYLNVGSNRLEVIRLIGDTHAEIKILNGFYKVGLDKSGEIKSKQQRYISLSGSSTFWYDLRDHKKLDHEPS